MIVDTRIVDSRRLHAIGHSAGFAFHSAPSSPPLCIGDVARVRTIIKRCSRFP